MDSLNPWLDVDELDRLAKALMAPAEAQQYKKAEAPKSEGLIRSSASKVLAKASEIAKRAGVIAPVVRQAALPELVEWLNTHARCLGLCVVDRDGDVLQAAMPNDEWTQLTVSAATTGHRLDEGKSHSLRLKVAAGSFLQFISVVTARGPLLVGLLTQNLLKDSQLIDFSNLVERISAADQVEK
ncbi:MAG: hypothetical protein ABGY95_12915 [Rubritalea sp.]|uniref:hypothetical protein n=1 Tax=Rubritalea sp. TaxID=2109375 RepID=UPI0032423FFC